MSKPRKPARPDLRRKFADARYETCKVCGLDWNISIEAVIDWRGYLCPQCRRAQKKEKEQ